MSTTIDNRIVGMQFDNSHFEKNVQTSLGTIDKLKQQLNFTGATKGLENINGATKNVNMSALGNAVETVQVKFSALQVIAVTALANITNSAVNAGKKMISALTIDPIKTGFNEYETQINAIQTILANTSTKGTSLQDVNSALDTLNTYADKTIYNFTEMTKNIGTFTAAGVDLDTSVKSIQGIANLAAVSGSTSQQASTAMYQLSQALAAGRVNLMDWNSVVNAGMGGQVFQDALVRTAAGLDGSAKSVDAWRKTNVDSYGSFRESLSQGGWLTTDVLTATLEQFTLANNDANKQMLISQGYSEDQAKSILEMAETASDAATKVKTFTQLWDTLKETAQSGWTKTWEIIVGDFGEAKTFLTRISDTIGPMIGAMSDARNNLLSGGLSSGWNQLLNSGIIDEDGYTNAIKEVVKGHGVAIDDMIKKEGSFEKALVSGLKSGSITSDMLSSSVTKLSDEFRAMSDEQLESSGYTKEQIKSLHDLEAGLQNGTVSMDEFVSSMSKSSGRENLIASLQNVFDGLLSVIKPITQAFKDIFPPVTAKQLYAFTEGLRELTSKLVLSDEQSAKLKTTFKGLFSVLDIFATVIKTVFGGVLTLLGGFDGLGDAILSVTSWIGNMLTGFRDNVKETNIFGTAIEKVTGFLTNVIDNIREFRSAVKERFSFVGFDVFYDVLTGIWKIISVIGKKIAEVGSVIGKALGEAFSGDFSTGLDILNTGIITAILLNLKKFTGGLTSSLKDVGGIKGFIDNIKLMFDSLRGTLETFQEKLRSEILLKIATAIGILAASLLIISMIDSDKLTSALGAITVLFVDLMGAMAAFDKLGGGKIKGVSSSIAAMIGISTAVLILAGALKMVSEIDPGKMLTGLIGVAALSAIVVASSNAMSKGKGKVMKGATSLVIFALAIKVLASACKDIASLSWNELAKGLTGVAILMGTVSIFLNKTKFSGGAFTTAISMVAIAAAIKILASACADFGSMNWGQLEKGLISIGILLLEIAIFSKLTGNAKHIISTGVSLVLIAGAMKIFASAMEDFSGMSWEEIGRGLTAMAGALLAVVIAVNLMPKNILGVSVSLVIVASALVILANALGTMGGMSWDEIGRGLTVLGGSLLILSVALFAMNGSLAGSAALIIAAGALAIIAPVLAILGGLTWGEIAKGLIALAGAFVLIGVAGIVLTPLIPAIIGLSVAFALFGVAILGIGAGVTLLAIGLASLATAGVAGATGLVAALSIIVTGLLNLIPLILSKLADIIVSICDAVVKSVPAITEAIAVVLVAVLVAITATIPTLITTFGILLDAVLDFLETYVPKLIDTGLTLVLALLNGIAENIGQITETAIEIVVAFIDAVAAKLPDVIDSGFKLIIAFINGLAEAIRGNAEPLRLAIKNLFSSVIEAGIKIITGTIKDIKEEGKKLIGDGLIKGIKDKIADFVKSVKELPEKAIAKIKEWITDFKDVGKDIVDGLISGIAGKVSGAIKAAKDLAKSILNGAKKALGINSPSREFMDVAKYSVMGLTNGITKFAKNAVNSAKDLGHKTTNALSNAMSRVSDVINSDIDSQPTIRPVLDLSNIKSGAGAIGNMLYGKTLAVDAHAVGAISESMMSFQNGNDNSDVVSAIKGLRKDLSNISGNTYNVNGVTYDDGSNIVDAVKSLVRATKIERRV